MDVVFCKGGYVALPVVFAAHVLRLNLIVHESDVHP
ncbi:MAG: glycosyltransferase [Candidatus Peribacteria bacterium]|nr:glycosyltransferase [Candidatus Peribacteria bacterium]